MRLRNPIVDLRRVLARTSSPAARAPTAAASTTSCAGPRRSGPLDHRAVSDAIAAPPHTPGARLSNTQSDAIHAALRGPRRDPAAYRRLVDDALDYKIDVLERAVAVLDRRRGLGAARRAPRARSRRAGGVGSAARAPGLDLVRFSRTYRPWRNAQVEMLDADGGCDAQLRALADPRSPTISRRTPARARSPSRPSRPPTPLRLEVASRRIVDGMTVVALHINQRGARRAPADDAADPEDQLQVRAAAARPRSTTTADGTSLGPAGQPAADGRRSADRRGRHVVRPPVHVGPRDRRQPPEPRQPGGAEADLHAHRPTRNRRTSTSWCCRPHTVAEAEWSDELAERRARGELNPEAWPPLVDEDRFDVLADDAAEPDAGRRTTPVPADLTLDDLD